MKKRSRRNLIIIALAVAALLIGGVAVYTKYQNWQTSKNFRPKADEGKSTPPSNPSQPTPQPNQPTTPPAATPAQPSNTAASGNIIVDSPTSGSVITSGTTVTGKAQVFEGQISYRVKAEKSGLLEQGAVQVQGDATKLAPFSFELAFTNQAISGDVGVLEVFSISPKDHSEINLVSIPVKF